MAMEPTGAAEIPQLALSPEKAAAAVGVCRSLIFRAIRDKELTARKMGARTLIETAEIARWLRSLPSKGRDPVMDAKLKYPDEGNGG